MDDRHSERRAGSPHSPLGPATTPSFELLFAGGVSLRKGVPYLLQAFANLRHPHKHLTVVGHISDEIRTLLPGLPTENVTFTGSLPQHELARLMTRSHALVLPSIEEGLALVQGQAMACGCPIIATAATGAEDLFTDGTNSLTPQPGFIIPAEPGNLANPTPPLTARLQHLADDPALQQSMRSAALARVQELAGWDQYGDLWNPFSSPLPTTERIKCNSFVETYERSDEVEELGGDTLHFSTLRMRLGGDDHT